MHFFMILKIEQIKKKQASRFSPEFFDHSQDGTIGETDSFPLSGQKNTDNNSYYARVLLYNEQTKVLRQGDTVEAYARSNYNKRVISVNTAEHEVAHLIQRLDGTTDEMNKEEKNSKNTNMRWLTHYQENFADTYAALRQISVNGSEGINELRRLIREGVFFSPHDPEHYSLNSLLKVYDYAQEHLEEIKASSPRKLYDLAKKLVAPIPKDEFTVLSTMSLIEIYGEVYRPSDRDRPSDDRLHNTAVDHLIDITARAKLIPDYYPKELNQFLDHFSSVGRKENPYNPYDPAMRADAQRYLDGYKHLNDYLPDQVDYEESREIESRAIIGFITNNPYEARELGLKQYDWQTTMDPETFQNEFVQTAINLRMLTIHGKYYEKVIQDEIIQQTYIHSENGEEEKRDGSIRGLRRALDIATKHRDIFSSGLPRDYCYEMALQSMKDDPKLQLAAYSGQFIIPISTFHPGGISYAVHDLEHPPAPQKVGFLEHDGIDPTVFIHADSYLRNIAQAGHKGMALTEKAIRDFKNDPQKKAEMRGAQIALEIANKNPQTLNGLGENECHQLLLNTLRTDRRLKSMATIENYDPVWWNGEDSGTTPAIVLPQSLRMEDSLLDGKMIPISPGSPTLPNE